MHFHEPPQSDNSTLFGVTDVLAAIARPDQEDAHKLMSASQTLIWLALKGPSSFSCRDNSHLLVVSGEGPLRLGIWRCDANGLQQDMSAKAADRQSVKVDMMSAPCSIALNIRRADFEPAARGSGLALENIRRVRCNWFGHEAP